MPGLAGDCCSCGLWRCLGASMSVHWTFWFNMIFQVVFAVIQYLHSWKYIVLIAVVWGPLSLLILIMHEFGHIFANRRMGGTCHYTLLWPLGGFNDCNIENGNCLQEFCVAFSGPLMQIPMFFFLFIILAIVSKQGISYYGSGFDIEKFDEGGAGIWFSEMAKRGIDVNLMVFAINLLIPVYPMDCSNMVAAMCVHLGLSVECTGYILVILGAALGVICLVYGIFSMIGGEFQGLFLIFVGIYALWMCWNLFRQVQDKTIHQHPIFAPDCYRRRSASASPQTNLSNPPPRRSNSRPRPKQKQLPPDHDEEMGNVYEPRSSSQERSKPKKKAGPKKTGSKKEGRKKKKQPSST